MAADVAVRSALVAVSSSGGAMTSPDGITWTLHSTTGSSAWRSVVHADGQHVAVALTDGPNSVMTSPDGITWTQRTTPATGWSRVMYGGGLFVAIGDDKLMTSPDGINWTSRTVSAKSWTGVTYGAGRYVIVGASGTTSRVAVSPN